MAVRPHQNYSSFNILATQQPAGERLFILPRLGCPVDSSIDSEVALGWCVCVCVLTRPVTGAEGQRAWSGITMRHGGQPAGCADL